MEEVSLLNGEKEELLLTAGVLYARVGESPCPQWALGLPPRRPFLRALSPAIRPPQHAPSLRQAAGRALSPCRWPQPRAA